MTFLLTEELLKQKRKGERLLLLIRHAERFPIAAHDPHHGVATLLTKTGKLQAQTFGEKLKPFSSAAYWSSPVMRCLETASLIAKGRGDTAPASPKDVPVLEALGSHFVADQRLFEMDMKEDFFKIFRTYFETGHHPAFRPLAPSAESLLDLILSLAFESEKELSVFVSHDAWIVSMLTYHLKMKFSIEHWVNFLSGMAVFFTDKNHTRLLPFTGLESGRISLAGKKTY
ncbi:MAG: histidine phosphatase family protein [Fibrobacter sp.]|jgi:broad specificity phosphatase PhoE|nr:histidine phosphatase family protein [Fibrobacter sp.]